MKPYGMKAKNICGCENKNCIDNMKKASNAFKGGERSAAKVNIRKESKFFFKTTLYT